MFANMDYLEYHEEDYYIHRNLRDRADPINAFTDNDFRERFRFHKASVMALVELLNDDLYQHNQRGIPVSPAHQVLITLRFYADGIFLREIGDTLNIDKATTSRIIHRVTDFICNRRHHFLSFPNQEQCVEYKRQFYELAHLPGIYP